MKLSQVIAIALAAGGIGLLAAGFRGFDLGKPLGVGLLVLAVVAQFVAIESGPDASADGGPVTPLVTHPLPTATHTTTEPTSSPLPQPTTFHTQLLASIHYNVGTTSATRHNLNQEWVALSNPGKNPVKLTGFTLSDQEGNVFTFPSFVLAPGAIVKIHTGSGGDNSKTLHWGSTVFVWNDVGDVARLKNSLGVTLSICRYGNPNASTAVC